MPTPTGSIGKVLLCVLALLAGPTAGPALAGDAAVGDDLSALGFIAGSWAGTMGEAEIEEVWTAPNGDSMLGMFRFVRDGKAVFFELQSIESTPQGLRLCLRHFNPGLVGWEEKDEALRLPLTELEKDRAIFGAPDGETRLEYHRNAPEELTITLHKFENGEKGRSQFRYRRAGAR